MCMSPDIFMFSPPPDDNNRILTKRIEPAVSRLDRNIVDMANQTQLSSRALQSGFGSSHKSLAELVDRHGSSSGSQLVALQLSHNQSDIMLHGIDRKIDSLVRISSISS